MLCVSGLLAPGLLAAQSGFSNYSEFEADCLRNGGTPHRPARCDPPNSPIVNPGPDPAEVRRQRDEHEARGIMEEGIDYLDRHEWNNAINSFSEALELEPDSREIANWLANARSARDRAMAAATAAAAQARAEEEARVRRAQAQARSLPGDAGGTDLGRGLSVGAAGRPGATQQERFGEAERDSRPLHDLPSPRAPPAPTARAVYNAAVIQADTRLRIARHRQQRLEALMEIRRRELAEAEQAREAAEERARAAQAAVPPAQAPAVGSVPAAAAPVDAADDRLAEALRRLAQARQENRQAALALAETERQSTVAASAVHDAEIARQNLRPPPPVAPAHAPAGSSR